MKDSEKGALKKAAAERNPDGELAILVVHEGFDFRPQFLKRYINFYS